MAVARSHHEADTLSRQEDEPTDSARDLPDDTCQPGIEGNLPMDILELLLALPTRNEIRLMLANTEESQRREAQDLRVRTRQCTPE